MLHRLLRAIVDDLVANGRLQYYTPLQDKPGFFQMLRRFIRELKRSRIEPEVLTTAVSDQPPHLQELALIYDRYQQWLQDKNWADDEGRGLAGRNRFDRTVRFVYRLAAAARRRL